MAAYLQNQASCYKCRPYPGSWRYALSLSCLAAICAAIILARSNMCWHYPGSQQYVPSLSWLMMAVLLMSMPLANAACCCRRPFAFIHAPYCVATCHSNVHDSYTRPIPNTKISVALMCLRGDESIVIGYLRSWSMPTFIFCDNGWAITLWRNQDLF